MGHHRGGLTQQPVPSLSSVFPHWLLWERLRQIDITYPPPGCCPLADRARVCPFAPCFFKGINAAMRANSVAHIFQRRANKETIFIRIPPDLIAGPQACVVHPNSHVTVIFGQHIDYFHVCRGTLEPCRQLMLKSFWKYKWCFKA